MAVCHLKPDLLVKFSLNRSRRAGETRSRCSGVSHQSDSELSRISAYQSHRGEKHAPIIKCAAIEAEWLVAAVLLLALPLQFRQAKRRA